MSDTLSHASAGRYVGQAVLRKEDPRLLTGRGRYTDDVTLPNMLHAHFVRSDVARAKFRVDVSAARDAEGVVAVFTGEDLNGEVAGTMYPSMFVGAEDFMSPMYPLAVGDVRFVGDPIALVIAESRYLAEDAAELIEIDYDDIVDPILDYDTALAGDGNDVHPNRPGNVVMQLAVPMTEEARAAVESAAHVVSQSFVQHRYSMIPMECRGVVARWEPFDRRLDVWLSSQNPHEARLVFSRSTGVPENQIRVQIGDVGGGFGLKSFVGREEIVVVLAAYVLGTTVKWSEDRRENLIASAHARQERCDVTLAVDDDGVLVGAELEHFDDAGAYPMPGGSAGPLVGMLITGPYRVPHLAWESTAIYTNTCGSASYRGPWMMETTAREQMMDYTARRLGLDPLEFRRRNILHRSDLPYQSAGGMAIENVTPEETLEQAAAEIGYDTFRAEQARATAEGRYLGIGFAVYVEPQPGVAAYANEPAHVRMHPDGRVDVFIGSGSHGQGLETTTAQLVAEHLGIDFEDVTVRQGDTDSAPFGPGTGGSRSGPMIGQAVTEASLKLRDKVVAIAAHLLEAAPEDLEIADGVVSVQGTPTKSVPVRQVANTAYQQSATLPPELDSLLDVVHRSMAPATMWSNATHAAIVELDPATGMVDLLRFVVSEDCGRMINPNIVEGQVHGGVAQGIGGVLYEHNVYDDDGNPLASTFMDYLVPTAHEIPEIETFHIESPASTVGGYKGVGEGGAIGAPAAVFNAVADALAQHGITVTEQPLGPDAVLAKLRQATG
ncbi:MAG TPA: xanthine dehydrogenase family protein molybdopterin-binding subunit [Acidimicrobiia bacterium]|jgi:carbon-monoxide dehydrogenase large subunit|nr:xanthine dehydrogenase family protein molybdopterin-binding subunit [Acidimicrobiia bacterium]